jgi:hypothetical protein
MQFYAPKNNADILNSLVAKIKTYLSEDTKCFKNDEETHLPAKF